MRITKKNHPELFCAYEHCGMRLSQKQLQRNARMDRVFSPEMKAKFCCREHKEAAARQRRSLRRRADRAESRGDVLLASELRLLADNS